MKRLLGFLSCHPAAGLSSGAARIDRAFNTVMCVSAALGLLLVVWIAFAILRRRTSLVQAVAARQSGFPWSIAVYLSAMLAIACALFWVGYVPFLDASVAPADAYEIQATSQNGSWSFSYPSGKVSDNRLVVPRWRPVRLVMSSKDTLHNLYLPQFRLQQTAIPGRYTSIWFEATQAKTIPIQCTNDCPSGRHTPEATLAIIEPDQFDQWLALSDKPKRGSAAVTNGAKP